MDVYRKILIVEDNPGDVRLIREALRDIRPAPELETAGDADEAWLKLTSGSRLPNLILLDFNLPKSGSKGLLQRIKDHATFRRIPVAVLTTSDADQDIRDAYQMHANCYLRKPVDLDGFFEIIHRAVEFWLHVASIPSSDG